MVKGDNEISHLNHSATGAAQHKELESNINLTVKFLNFGTPEILSVIYLTFKQRGETSGYLSKMVQRE